METDFFKNLLYFLLKRRLKLDIRKNLFMKRLIRHWNKPLQVTASRSSRR